MSQTKWILVCLTLLPVIGTVGTDGRLAKMPPVAADCAKPPDLRRQFPSCWIVQKRAVSGGGRSLPPVLRGVGARGRVQVRGLVPEWRRRRVSLELLLPRCDAGVPRSTAAAERLGDDETDGVISLNLVALYLQLGDLSAAAVEADRAAKKVEKVPNSAYLGEALGQAAKLRRGKAIWKARCRCSRLRRAWRIPRGTSR